jgi:large subunit ribosomal protein L7/L12
MLYNSGIGKNTMSTNLDNIVDQLSNLTVMEGMQLVRTLEDKWGVSATQAACPVQTETKTVTVTEEQQAFTVTLKQAGEKRIEVIKMVRTLNSALGLKEAKELVEALPKVLKEGATKEEAAAIKSQLEAFGAIVELS